MTSSSLSIRLDPRWFKAINLNIIKQELAFVKVLYSMQTITYCFFKKTSSIANQSL